jgi:hypothetical protein
LTDDPTEFLLQVDDAMARGRVVSDGLREQQLWNQWRAIEAAYWAAGSAHHMLHGDRDGNLYDAVHGAHSAVGGTSYDGSINNVPHSSDGPRYRHVAHCATSIANASARPHFLAAMRLLRGPVILRVRRFLATPDKLAVALDRLNETGSLAAAREVVGDW